MTGTRSSLYGKNIEEIKSILHDFGEPDFRAKQIFSWIYRHHARTLDDMTSLPKSLRAALSQRFDVGWNDAVGCTNSLDGTKKYLFSAGDRQFIEAAWIPDAPRATLCVSTQIGCKMACAFCATAKMGHRGNLSAGEILNQYFSIPERETITNLVYMGMGEPLDNLDEVLKSLSILGDSDGFGFSPRHITVSTVGLLPQLQRIIDESKVHLALSMHSPFDEERRAIMPVQQVFPLKEILETLKRNDWSGSRRLSVEYIMFDELNDSHAHAREVVRVLNGIACRVNLIPYHFVPGSRFLPSSQEKMVAFQNVLKEKGLQTTIRRSRGMDIQAACGLLSTKELARQRASDVADW